MEVCLQVIIQQKESMRCDLVNPRAWQTVLVAPTTGGYEQDGGPVIQLKLEDGKRILFWYDNWVGREYSSTRQVPDLFSFAENSRATVNVEAIKVGQ
ncbi:hypothetical protein KY289_001838 [Solanum tuberosum]|nr:hypothetical protein KY289_001838 [Solanum tuberosum]